MTAGTYRARVTRRTGRETASGASADTVVETANETGATHLDDGRNGLQGARVDRRRGVGVSVGVVRTAAESVVDDLTTLRVSNQDQLGVRALLVEGVHSRGNSLNAFLHGGRVVIAAAGGLPSATKASAIVLLCP